MKCNELGNPVEYDEIYSNEKGLYKDVVIDGDNAEAILKEIDYLVQRKIIDETAGITLEIREILKSDVDDFYKLIEKIGKTHTVKVKFFLKGFSQKSYDRLQAGDFQKYLNQIDEIARKTEMLRGACIIEIVYLLYQFNMCEVHKTASYVKEKQMGFYCMYAAFEDMELKKRYLALEMPVGDLIHYSESYFFTYLDELEGKEEKMYEKFRQEKVIKINKFENLILEWYGQEQKERSVYSFSDKKELDDYYSKNFEAASREPYAGKIWLWNQCENKNRNELFMV